jgi:hypothetical protein
MIKIACLFDTGSRFPLMIAEGLLKHPHVEVFFNKPVYLLGRLLAAAIDPGALLNSLVKCDLIFLPDLEHFRQIAILHLINQHNLWHKVVIYDFKDSPLVDKKFLSCCKAYFKRSCCIGSARTALPAHEKPIIPLNFSLLDSYIELAPAPAAERTIDIGYYFDPVTIAGDQRRGNVLKCLLEENWSGYAAIIGKVTTTGGKGRRGIFDDPNGNPWYDYFQSLHRTKIIFSAFPDGWDGDSRTWEAISSKALCFLDKSCIPTPHYFEDGRHCFFYDATDKASIQNAIKLAKLFLYPGRKEARENIAQNGYEHALQYHQSVHRVDYMLHAIGALPYG